MAAGNPARPKDENLPGSKPGDLGWVHPFERAGLGKGPFRCIGMTENWYPLGDGTSKPGGSCDFCGTGIAYQYLIRSSDGKQFKVGIDCVGRTRDTQLEEQARREHYAAESREARERWEAHRKEEEARRKPIAARNLITFADLLPRLKAMAESRHVSNYHREVMDALYTNLIEGRQEVVHPESMQKLEEAEAAHAMGERLATLPPSKHVGFAGEKIGPLVVMLVFEHRFETQFGPRTINKMRVLEGPHAGATLAWFTSGGPEWKIETAESHPASQQEWVKKKGVTGRYVRTVRPDVTGEFILLKASVKENDFYQGEAQTVIVRPTFGPTPEEAAEDARWLAERKREEAEADAAAVTVVRFDDEEARRRFAWTFEEANATTGLEQLGVRDWPLGEHTFRGVRRARRAKHAAEVLITPRYGGEAVTGLALVSTTV
jgi:hypothetical protein